MKPIKATPKERETIANAAYYRVWARGLDTHETTTHYLEALVRAGTVAKALNRKTLVYAVDAAGSQAVIALHDPKRGLRTSEALEE